MKGTRAEAPKVFQPVTLTLETQAEVDAIFTLINHSDTRRVSGLERGAYEALEKYNDQSNCHKLHMDLCKMMQNYY